MSAGLGYGLNPDDPELRRRLQQMQMAAQRNGVRLDAEPPAATQAPPITQADIDASTRYDPGRSYFQEARGDTLQPLTTQLPSERAGAAIRGENPRDISPGRAKVADLVEGALSYLPSDSGYTAGTNIAEGDYAQAALNVGAEYADKVIPGAGKAAKYALPAMLGGAALRKVDDVVLPAAARAVDDIPLQKVGGTLGENTDAVTFKGKSPHDFEPHEWNEFGEAYGVKNLGPASTDEWRAGMKTITGKSGREYQIPGGEEPFTYYDLLHNKGLGIDPNDLTDADRKMLHSRTVGAMQPRTNDTLQTFNGLTMGMISPNQPLTPNELAQARIMAKSPEDINRLGGMIPWDYKDSSAADAIVGYRQVKDKATGEMVQRPITLRQQSSAEIAKNLGVQAKGKGGLGVSGSADYTRIAEMAQMYQDKPEFFKFGGAAEGGADEAEQWANYVERLTNQVPGLSAKTGSFGSVWQAPETAATSAMDRHMGRKFTTEMFPTPEEADTFKQKTIDKFNKSAKTKVDTWEALPLGARDDAMFGYLNSHPSMKYRDAKTGEINPRVSPNLRDVDWIKEPKDVQTISAPYKRTLSAQAGEAAKEGQGVFSNQWYIWDALRKRHEPHEIMFPGLESLPRMNMDQMKDVLTMYRDKGYLAAPGPKAKPVRQFDASKGAYFGIGGGAVGLGAFGEELRKREEEDEKKRRGSSA